MTSAIDLHKGHLCVCTSFKTWHNQQNWVLQLKSIHTEWTVTLFIVKKIGNDFQKNACTIPEILSPAKQLTNFLHDQIRPQLHDQYGSMFLEQNLFCSSCRRNVICISYKYFWCCVSWNKLFQINWKFWTIPCNCGEDNLNNLRTMKSSYLKSILTADLSVFFQLSIYPESYLGSTKLMGICWC